MRTLIVMIVMALAPATVTAQASAQSIPRFWVSQWAETDFSNNAVESWNEILSGGPPKDGIPAIDAPQFIEVSQEQAIPDLEPVIAVEIDGARPRAYPIRYLMWHEIVNDEIDGMPIAVTFCPLCNSGLTFDRRTSAGVLSFGVSGKLRNSDMVMYDRQTQSWWQQATGTGIVGDMTDEQLVMLPTWMESWANFKGRNPDGLVMAEPAGYNRNYGRNPYLNYDSSTKPFLYNGENPPHDISPLARVVRVGARAWLLSRLAEEDEIVEDGVRLTWEAGQASALDQSVISASKDVGNVRVHDAATGGALVHDIMFAFAYHAFWPEGEWMLSP